jgi:hypothetical protein
MHPVGKFQIDLYRDESFEKGCADNVHSYDLIYFDDSPYIFPTMIGIKVFKENELLKSAIIASSGGGTGIHKNSVLYEDERVLVCCSDSIFCLSIPDLELLWRTKADSATCFGIFRYQDSYIIHGELEISRLDRDGKIIWQKGGADIFTTISGAGPDFELKDDYIQVKDFQNKVYRFDYNGRDLTDKSQFPWPNCH